VLRTPLSPLVQEISVNRHIIDISRSSVVFQVGSSAAPYDIGNYMLSMHICQAPSSWPLHCLTTKGGTGSLACGRTPPQVTENTG